MNEENLQEAAVEQQDTVLEEVNTQEPAQAQPDNSASANIVRLREAKEKAEKEREQLRLQLEDMQRKMQTKQEPEQEELEYGDEDFVEGRILKKELDSVKKQLDAYKTQQAQQSDEDRLMRTYPDFSRVACDDNLRRLREMDPETADTIAKSTASLYTRGAAAYKRIKELGIFVEDTHQKDRAKAQENISKPRPSNSVSPQQGDSPLSMANAFANGLTPELKKQLWKEMQEASKRI